MKLFARIWLCIKVTARLLDINFQILHGLWKISKLPRPCVSIFGGSRHFEREQYYHDQAEKAASLLVRNNISVITGGGPGVMEAANCGAHVTPTHQDRTIKIIITDLGFDEEPNKCPGEEVRVSDFFARKWLLIDYSIGYIIFPGGLGTLDELSDLMNLMHTGKLKPRTVVLIGVEYWKPYKEFFTQAREQNFINQNASDLLITDDIEEAVNMIIQHCETCRPTNK